MSIPESQCATWANQGATAGSAAAYESIRNALAAVSSPVRGRDIEIYLQGSYRNDTNVRGDSDVDVVVQLNGTYYRNISRLSPAQQMAYEARHSPADYLWSQFRDDVLSALQASYGTALVRPRNKCITVAGAGARLTVDVVAAEQYRDYSRFVSQYDESHETGMTFWTMRQNRQIVNWPKQHHANGVAKNGRSRTNGRYKPAVRMFKNARSAAVERGILAEADAPSFFVECLIYNVPDDHFTVENARTLYKVLAWLENEDISRFVCGNELVDLVGAGPEQWRLDAAQRTVIALIQLWNTW
jgi:Nucleotidyltransferase domain